MHDVSFAKRIIFLLKAKIGKIKNYKKVVVNVTLGPFTHVTPDSLLSAFNLLNEGEGLRAVALNIQRHKAQIKCGKCQAVTEIAEPVTSCPQCGADDFELLNSEEFMIQSIEIERD